MLDQVPFSRLKIFTIYCNKALIQLVRCWIFSLYKTQSITKGNQLNDLLQCTTRDSTNQH